MKNAVIYCFSGSGNTKKICRLYADEFERQGVETVIYDVVKDFPKFPNPSEYFYVGFAYPVHGFNAPSIMLDFADVMPKQNGKKYFTLSCGGEALRLNNGAGWKLNAKLKRKGYALSNEYHYVMPYNMIFRHSDFTAQKMWSTVKNLAPIEADEILAGKNSETKKAVFGKLVSAIVRIEQPTMKINGKFFKVDGDKCIKCMKCVKNCPTKNIRYQDGKFVFGDDCLCCTRCSFNCPADAINIALLNGWRVNGAYPMEKTGGADDGRHKRYCRRSYARYFADAEKKIEAAPCNASANGVQ